MATLEREISERASILEQLKKEQAQRQAEQATQEASLIIGRIVFENVEFHHDPRLQELLRSTTRNGNSNPGWAAIDERFRLQPTSKYTIKDTAEQTVAPAGAAAPPEKPGKKSVAQELLDNAPRR